MKTETSYASPTKTKRDWWLLCMIVVATVATVLLYQAFLQSPESRWGRLDNDRNSHYLTGLKLGIDLRNGDFGNLFDDVRRIRTWPPLHALAIGLTTAIAGPRFEIAVLPNVFAWGAGAVLIFLLARRLVSTGGNIAGIFAAAFYLSSPSHRAFAADFMLESLGSMLTLLCLYLYVRYRQEDNTPRALGFALTLLFFEKYNYWLLVMLPLLLVEAWHRREALLRFWSSKTRGTLVNWLRWQPKVWANYPVGIVLCVLLVSIVQKWSPRHENLLNITFALLMLRIAVQWRVEGVSVWQWLSNGDRKAVLWHALPLSVWFLLPKRLGYFLFFVGPMNGANSDRGWIAAASYYCEQAAQWYHGATWLAVLAATLALVAALRWRAVRPETLAFLTIGLLLMFKHPNQKTRFLHTSMPALWVLSSVGLVVVCDVFRKLGHARLGTVARVAVASLIVAMQLPTWHGVGGSPESGHGTATSSSLQLAQTYLPWLADGEQVALLGTLPIETYAEWTYLTEYPDRERPLTAKEMLWFSPSEQENQARFSKWMSENHPGQVVMIDVDDDSRIGFPDFQQFRELMPAQRGYVMSRSEHLPELGCRVTLWEPRPTIAASDGPTRR